MGSRRPVAVEPGRRPALNRPYNSPYHSRSTNRSRDAWRSDDVEVVGVPEHPRLDGLRAVGVAPVGVLVVDRDAVADSLDLPPREVRPVEDFPHLFEGLLGVDVLARLAQRAVDVVDQRGRADDLDVGPLGLRNVDAEREHSPGVVEVVARGVVGQPLAGLVGDPLEQRAGGVVGGATIVRNGTRTRRGRHSCRKIGRTPDRCFGAPIPVSYCPPCPPPSACGGRMGSPCPGGTILNTSPVPSTVVVVLVST